LIIILGIHFSNAGHINSIPLGTNTARAPSTVTMPPMMMVAAGYKCEHEGEDDEL
jgi:hypothetical protein